MSSTYIGEGAPYLAIAAFDRIESVCVWCKVRIICIFDYTHYFSFEYSRDKCSDIRNVVLIIARSNTFFELTANGRLGKCKCV